MIAGVEEVEREEDIERLAVERREIEMERGRLEKSLVLPVRGGQVGRIDVPRAEAMPLEADPAVGSLVVVFFEDEVAVLARLEVGELREDLLQTVEEVEDGLAFFGELHLRVHVNGDAEVIRKRAEFVHDASSGAVRFAEITGS